MSRANEYAWDTGTIDGKSVSNSASDAVAANANRKYLAIVNAGATDVYIALGTDAIASKGICLKASGGSYEINANNIFHGRVSAITASSTSTLTIQEGT